MMTMAELAVRDGIFEAYGMFTITSLTNDDEDTTDGSVINIPAGDDCAWPDTDWPDTDDGF